MKLFIPTIGTKFKLCKPWTFRLYHEHRNEKPWDALVPINFYSVDEYLDEMWDFGFELPTAELDNTNKFTQTYGNAELSWLVTLPTETILSVSRIYIRQGASDFDSITFDIPYCPDPRLMPKKARGFMTGRARFWAKLDEVNGIEVELIGDQNEA